LLRQRPDDSEALALLGEILLASAPSEVGLALVRRAIELRANPEVHSTLLLQSQYADDVSPQALFAAHSEWNAKYAALVGRRQASGLQAYSPARRLRLGFVSPNMGRHPIAFCVLPALEHLDKTKCSIACYSDRLLEDDYTSR